MYEILQDPENRSNLANFDPFLNGLCMKYYQTTKIEATFSILTRLWMVLVWNITRPRKSKQPSQFWPVLKWSMYEILLNPENRSNLLNFDPFQNGLCMKFYQTTKIEATFSILTRFWKVFVWNPTRPRKLKQPSQFWPVFEWFWYEILSDHGNRSNLPHFYPFLNGLCMKSC